MHTSIRKRIFTILAAVAMTVAFGCGKAVLDERVSAAPSDEIVSIGTDSSDGGSGSAVVAASGESSGESFVSAAPDKNAILVQNGNVRSIAGATIDKTGDAAGDFSSGGNAAIAVLSQGQLTLLASNVTTNALGGTGLFVSGEGSVLTADKNYLITTGDSSPALAVMDGGALAFTDGTITTEGTQSPCVLLGGGSVSLSRETLYAKNSVPVRVLSGENELSLDNMSLSESPSIAEDAFLTLRLTNDASFSGSFGAALPAQASVYLDETSSLALTGDSYLRVFSNAGAAHQNIQSNGYSLYYDSNAPENEYLGAQAYLLPGGGFLTPLI